MYGAVSPCETQSGRENTIFVAHLTPNMGMQTSHSTNFVVGRPEGRKAGKPWHTAEIHQTR